MSVFRWINDHSGLPPRLNVRLNLGTLDDLPEESTAPRARGKDLLLALRDAGYEGIQAGEEFAVHAASTGMRISGSGRVDSPEDALELSCRMVDYGADACTLHVGTGFEDDHTVDRLCEAIIKASDATGLPLFVETHRATITQDCWRTIQILSRHPQLMINGDFSHWYTGLEMVYGDFEFKLSKLQPVFARTGFMHGRIGTPGCIQVAIDPPFGDDGTEPRTEAQHVRHFREIWTRCFREFLDNAGPGDMIVFAPELLAPRIAYARTFQGREESDRWVQASYLAKIARQCFENCVKERGFDARSACPPRDAKS
ncbi:MAG: hypothetical protein KatS3mg104_1266 [Phycisphaerae bacterium]|jgi:hypothetical protein|nr:MAG: hypothetical protein KatS3mg104_1266 [Phycisphaerae bacterium]